MIFGRAILGDNQFLGVNHANQARAAELYKHYSDPDSVLQVISYAYDAGVRDFMFTTHDRYYPVLEEIRRSNLFPDMYFNPCLPYAHKYWNQISDKGPVNLLTSTLAQVNLFRAIPAMLGLLACQTRGLTYLLTEIETLMCKGLRVRGVFLQNAAFDFLMALEQYRIIEQFADAVSHRLSAVPGFITMNHGCAAEVLCENIGLTEPWLCANYNISGFRMNPSQKHCEISFASRKTKNIAMSVFSSGNQNPTDALDYVISKLDGGGVDSILFGSSSQENIHANVERISGVFSES